MFSMPDLPQCHKQSFFHGYCFLKICRDMWNVLSYSLHYIVKCWRRHSAVLKKIWWNLFLAHYRGDEIPLIDTGFEICHVCLASPHHLNQILRHYSPAERNTLRALTDAIVLLAGRCHAGHKNASRLHAHGSACTQVACTQDVALECSEYFSNTLCI
jgi:hypothetical protein